MNNIKSQKVQDAANFLYNIGNNGEKLMLLGDPVADFLAGKAALCTRTITGAMWITASCGTPTASAWCPCRSTPMETVSSIRPH